MSAPVVTEPYYLKLLEVAQREDFPDAMTRLTERKRAILDPDSPMEVSALWDYLRYYEVPEEDIKVLQRVPLPRAPRPPKGMDYLEFYKAVGKNVVLGIRESDLPKYGLHLKAWAKAISSLPHRAAALYHSEVRKVILDTSRGTEDASWGSGGVLRLVLKEHSSPDPKIYRIRAVHELGHALEEKLGVVLTPWTSIYGNPPFVSDYAKINASEDFAESFRSLELDGGDLKRVAPEKYMDLKTRLGEVPSAARVARRHLTGSTFDLEEFRPLRTLKDRVAYLQANAKYLGKGLSRVVLDIGGGRVLKLTMRGADDPKSNAREAKASACLKGSGVIPHVLDAAKDYSWIITERATPVKGKFLALLNASLKMPPGLAFEDGEDFSRCLDLAADGTSGNTPQLEWLTNHPTKWWQEMLSAVITCNLGYTDMKPENWGVLKGRLVLLDYGG